VVVIGLFKYDTLVRRGSSSCVGSICSSGSAERTTHRRKGAIWLRKRDSKQQQSSEAHQLSSLIGASASIPLSKHQSLKIGYNSADYVQYGGFYQNVSVGWQYSWLGQPN